MDKEELKQLKIDAEIITLQYEGAKVQRKYEKLKDGGQLPDDVVEENGFYYKVDEIPAEEVDEYLKLKNAALLNKIEKHVKVIKGIMVFMLTVSCIAAVIALIAFFSSL